MVPPPAPVPTLGLLELSYGGLTFGGLAGPTSRYNFQSFAKGSLSLPPYMTGDVQRAIDQGQFGGVDLAGGRDIQANIIVKGATGADLDAARQELGGVLPPQGEVELPLYVRLPSGVYACMAKPRGADFDYDVGMVFALGGVVPCSWHATDPRWYAMPTLNQQAGTAGPVGGMTFDAVFDISFGGGRYGSFIDVLNTGKYECRPLLVIAGPCVNPIVSNLSLPGAPAIGVNIGLAAGDQLVIDTDFQTVQYTAAGTTVAVSRKNDLMTSTVWWNLPPLPLNTIRFATGDATATTATLTVQSAPAFLQL